MSSSADEKARRVASLLSSYYAPGEASGNGGPAAAARGGGTPRGAGGGTRGTTTNGQPSAVNHASTARGSSLSPNSTSTTNQLLDDDGIFDADAWLASLLQRAPLSELLATHARLASEVKVRHKKVFFSFPGFFPTSSVCSLSLILFFFHFQNKKQSLDSEMQSLVHENYARFIAATDTIRALRSGVAAEAAPAAARLRSSLDEAARTGADLDSRLSRHAASVGELSRV